MGTLSDILSSRVRAEIFRLLFGLDEKEVHLREMERQASLSLGTIRQDLQKLVKLDLVTSRRDGNRLYYRANTGHPLYPDIRKLVLKTAGLVEIFKSVLDRDGVEVAFVFGSLASSRERAASDVDLMDRHRRPPRLIELAVRRLGADRPGDQSSHLDRGRIPSPQGKRRSFSIQRLGVPKAFYRRQRK